MSILLLILVSSFSGFFLFVLGFRKARKTGLVTDIPKGSLGFPVIGETLSFLRAQEKNEGHKWIDERVSKHGNVFKTHLMGSPTVVLVGQAANKFLFTAPDDVLAAKQPFTINAIAGKNNIFELTGSRYKVVKGAMMSFLKPETLANYTGQMDCIVKHLIAEEVAKQSDHHHTVKAVTLMKTLTFHVACDILFGIQDEPTKQALFDDFTLAFKAVWSLPLNFPGTPFWKGLRARSRIEARVQPIMRKRREEVESGRRGPTSDVVSCLMGLREEGGEAIEEEVIMDNFVTLMIASHDTSAILASLMIWKLSRDQDIYNKVLEEQMEIKKTMIERSKQGNGPESLTWADIQKMKYTWRVSQELMRHVPPVFGSFRKALRDIPYGDHRIPKGWQVFWAACGTHLNDGIFENPNEFDPMRFENPSKAVPPYAYVAFGGGVRTCIGNEFARVETLTIIHNMVTTYEWSQVNPDEVITRQPMPYPSLGLPIKIKPMSTSFADL